VDERVEQGTADATAPVGWVDCADPLHFLAGPGARCADQEIVAVKEEIEGFVVLGWGDGVQEEGQVYRLVLLAERDQGLDLVTIWGRELLGGDQSLSLVCHRLSAILLYERETRSCKAKDLVSPVG
jgi:hypothetical protein